jgi:hypothetical protein
METLGNFCVAKNGNDVYYCKKCDYGCSKKYNWDKHLNTAKHMTETPGNNMETESGKTWQQDVFKCEFCNEPKGKLNWANRNHTYKRNLTDWISLCQSCHMYYDKWSK